MKAIISVSNKSGIADLAKKLHDLGIELYSTGGTKKALDKTGLPVHSISELTGFPEIMDGRVKTLHPGVHGGLLARRDKPEHLKQLAEQGISTIDIAVINLYPFRETIAKENVTEEDAIENIDIGGPAMVRASAKNFAGVLILTDPTDYNQALEYLACGYIPYEFRKKLGQKAFQHTASYDTAIAQYLRKDETNLFPQNMTIALSKRYDLRYGENPHQQGAFYSEYSPLQDTCDSGIALANQLWGKELSYNNIMDAEAAWTVVCDFADPCVAIVKHTNTCGLSCDQDIAQAYKKAYEADTVSAFGGIVAANRDVTLAMASEMSSVFYEIIIAPGYSIEALEILKQKKNLRILVAPLIKGTPYMDYRRIRGGLLVQQADTLKDDEIELKCVTKRQPTEQELKDLRFAFKACKHIKSNAIVLAKNLSLTGMGSGQPNRVISVRIAGEKAGVKAKGSVMASDAFFPFADNIEQAYAAGITAVIQPGGSIRDDLSIEACDKFDIAMVFTGVRHFKH
ncbi:MAG: bifunctional phosphoribosylaminoimidazolecarboxamide formyltransferase/IMP cyclohydrolase [Chloroflexi bacterium]|nr:bifunctional phosphoribosylaminoimidazolecarboxamide formyltransferase/IMP cyclohydrolase [Chloroflexota bacterium]